MLKVKSVKTQNCKKSNAKSRGVGTQGGRPLPLGVFGPLRAEGPREPKLLRRHPKPAQKSRNMCGNPPKKHVRTVEGPLAIWKTTQKKTGPL